MLIELTCPHCHALVSAREADRGETVRCGICYGEVPVPAAAAPAAVDSLPPVPAPIAPPPVPVAPPPTAPPLPVAQLLPPKPRTVTAQPIPAAIPAAPRPPRMRSPLRDDEDDEDPIPKGKSPIGILVLLAALAFVVLGGLATGIYLVVHWTGRSDATAGAKEKSDDPKPLWDPQQDPQRPGAMQPFAPVPAFPPPAVIPVPAPMRPQRKPAPEPEWKPVENKDGFEITVPGRMTVRESSLVISGRMRVQEKLYHTFPSVHVAGVARLSVEVQVVDYPNEFPFDLERAVKDSTRFRSAPTKPCTLGGKAGFEAEEVMGATVWTSRGIKVGPRFFLLRCDVTTGDLYPKSEDYRAKVFDSFKVTYDEKTPPPPPTDAFGKPVPGGDPIPGVPPAPPPATTPGQAGAIAVVARPQPFWAAFFLPDRDELVTLGPRLTGNLGRGGGVLRRYDLPNFQLRATYLMPRPATRAVYDAATRTLYCTTLAGNRVDQTIRDTERLVAFGDVEAYDFGAVLKGGVPDNELKPTFVVPGNGAKLTGLDRSPDGQWLYTVRTLPIGPATKPRGWKASLVRIDVAQRKMLDPIDLPSPVLDLTLTADGKTIYLAEIPPDVGGEGPGAGKVDAVDTAAWRMDHNVVFNAAVHDAAVAGPRLVCSLKSRNTAGLGSCVAAGGDELAYDLLPDPARPAGYLRLTADGKRLVTSARLGEGVEIYEVVDLFRKDGLKLLAKGNDAAKTPLGGHFYLSPDGRFAVFQSGAVVDVVRPTKKPE
jgi:hypothetical protein